jgi:hypothetical protein
LQIAARRASVLPAVLSGADELRLGLLRCGVVRRGLVRLGPAARGAVRADLSTEPLGALCWVL